MGNKFSITSKLSSAKPPSLLLSSLSSSMRSMTAVDDNSKKVEETVLHCHHSVDTVVCQNQRTPAVQLLRADVKESATAAPNTCTMPTTAIQGTEQPQNTTNSSSGKLSSDKYPEEGKVPTETKPSARLKITDPQAQFSKASKGAQDPSSSLAMDQEDDLSQQASNKKKWNFSAVQQSPYQYKDFHDVEEEEKKESCETKLTEEIQVLSSFQNKISNYETMCKTALPSSPPVTNLTKKSRRQSLLPKIAAPPEPMHLLLEQAHCCIPTQHGTLELDVARPATGSKENPVDIETMEEELHENESMFDEDDDEDADRSIDSSDSDISLSSSDDEGVLPSSTQVEKNNSKVHNEIWISQNNGVCKHSEDVLSNTKTVEKSHVKACTRQIGEVYAGDRLQKAPMQHKHDLHIQDKKTQAENVEASNIIEQQKNEKDLFLEDLIYFQSSSRLGGNASDWPASHAPPSQRMSMLTRVASLLRCEGGDHNDEDKSGHLGIVGDGSRERKTTVDRIVKSNTEAEKNDLEYISRKELEQKLRAALLEIEELRARLSGDGDPHCSDAPNIRTRTTNFPLPTYYALRKSTAFTGPVIFLSREDCITYGTATEEFQSFHRISDVLKFCLSHLRKEGNQLLTTDTALAWADEKSSCENPYSRKFHAFRKSDAFRGPVIFISLEDRVSCIPTTKKDDFQSFDSISEALKFAQSALQKHSPSNSDGENSNGKRKRRFNEIAALLKPAKSKKAKKTKNRRRDTYSMDYETKLNIAFEERVSEWLDYRARYGCDPKGNIALGKWVVEQRYKYRLAKRGKVRGIRKDRIARLEELGFEWANNNN